MGYLGTPIDTNNTFQSLQGKRFSGNGSTTAFTLDIAPASTLDIEVFVENVRQDPNSAYSLSGTTLTFAAAPDAGTNNIYVVHQAKAVATISAGAGTVNAASMDNTVISGHDALAAEPADTDEFLVSDAGTIKRIDYSLIKAGLPGITMVNMWHRPSNFSLSGGTYTTVTGLQKLSITGAGNFGSDMTESSGIFTFPSTGIYKVEFMFNIFGGGGLYSGARLQTTVDNSTYVTVSEGYNNQYTTDAASFGVIPYHFDVTNTTTHKVKFLAVAHGASNLGGGSLLYSGAIFTRLGDT